MGKIDYRSAGVDIDAGNEAVENIKEIVGTTFTKNVLTGIGSFGSLFQLKSLLSNYKAVSYTHLTLPTTLVV